MNTLGWGPCSPLSPEGVVLGHPHSLSSTQTLRFFVYQISGSGRTCPLQRGLLGPGSGGRLFCLQIWSPQRGQSPTHGAEVAKVPEDAGPCTSSHTCFFPSSPIYRVMP